MDRDEWAGRMRTAQVNGPRQHSLAGAAFAAQQHRGVARGRFEGQVERRPHGRIGRLQVGLGHRLLHLLLQVRDARAQPA